MRRFIASIFLLLLFTSANECRQLLHIPILVQHYLKHQKEGDHLSFFSFLKLHYIDQMEKDIDNDDAEDQKLPFKHLDGIDILAGYFPLHHPQELLPPPVIYVPKASFGYKLFIPSQLAFQVFHPPRVS